MWAEYDQEGLGMRELPSINGAKNHLDQPSMEGGPKGGAVPKDALVKSSMLELCMSLGFTAEPGFLNQSSLDWLIQAGYITAQSIENRSYPDYYTTPKGDRCGLRSVQFISKAGTPRFNIVCGEQGRQLLRNSIKQILALERTRWEPLLACLTPKWHTQASISEKPVNLTNMVKQINRSLPQDLSRKLSPQKISTWLVKNDLMETVVIRNAIKRQPTAAGERIGIQSTLRERNGLVLWHSSAQRFIWDNLNEIVQDLASGEAYKWGPREPVFSEEFRRSLHSTPKLVPAAYLEVVINSALNGESGCPDVFPKGLILSWLYQGKYYTARKEPDGRWSIFLTEKGTAAGLAISEGALRLSEAGQQFVYDHLQQILDYYKTL
jgi:hypothetical protein